MKLSSRYQYNVLCEDAQTRSFVLLSRLFGIRSLVSMIWLSLRTRSQGIENEALVAAFMKSSKSLEEAIAFLRQILLKKIMSKRRNARVEEGKN